MNVPHTAATVSLELRGGPGLTVNSAPQGARSWIFAGAAFVSGLVYLIRKGYSDGVRRRVIRRLDAIAPRSRYNPDKLREGSVFNADCSLTHTFSFNTIVIVMTFSSPSSHSLSLFYF